MGGPDPTWLWELGVAPLETNLTLNSNSGDKEMDFRPILAGLAVLEVLPEVPLVIFASGAPGGSHPNRIIFFFSFEKAFGTGFSYIT